MHLARDTGELGRGSHWPLPPRARKGGVTSGSTDHTGLGAERWATAAFSGQTREQPGSPGRRVRTRDAQNSQGQRWAPLGEPASTVEMIIMHMTPRATWEQ